MTVTFLHIVVYFALIAVGAAVGVLYSRRSTRIQPPKPVINEVPSVVKQKIDELREQIHDIELKNEKLELQAAEMKEFVTRSMNRISARSSKLDKNQETWEQMQALLEQSKEVDANGHHDDRHEKNQTNMFPARRLVRVSKGDM